MSGVVVYQVGGPSGERLRDEPGSGRLYDAASGELVWLATDRDRDLWFDMWTRYEAGVVLQSQFDQNNDDVVDYWRHMAPDGSLVNVGFSARGDGIEDGWTYFDEDGALIRAEYSTRRDGTIDRIERYSDGQVVAVETSAPGAPR